MAFLSPDTVADGKSLNVGKLFEVFYLIPNYQRDFAWGEKQIRQLWSDLTDHYRRVAPFDDLVNPQGYFLGAMVAIQEGNKPDWEVVDGQQRLTTLSTLVIVLCEILNKYASQIPQTAALIHGLKNCFVTYQGGALRPWMSYSDQVTNEAFNKLCLGVQSRRARKSVWNGLEKKFHKKTSPYFVLWSAFEVSYSQMITFLRSAPPESRANRAIAFAQMILDCIVILRIKAGSYEGAYAIFESLNDRGLRLSQADLVKNELLKISSANDRDEIVDHWTNAKQLLSDTPIIMSELLHYSCLHRYGASKAQGLFSFVKDLLKSGHNPKVFASGLKEDAIALEQIIVLRPQVWSSQTVQMLDDITKVISVKFSYPMLMAIHKRFGKHKREFEKSVKLVMNFLYRYMTVGGGTPERLSVAASAVGKICRNQAIADAQALKEISFYFTSESPDSTFEHDFKEFSIANTKLAYFSVYYLEAHLLRGTMPLPHGAESNLEHIMPRTPTQKDWPNALASKQVDLGAYNDLIWRIGNLLPLPEDINKSVKNKSISHKLTGGSKNYLTANLISPKSLSIYMGASQEWDEQAIFNRQLNMAKMAPNVWSLAI